MARDPTNVGFTLDPKLLDELDAYVAQRNEDSIESVSRSQVAREALPLGLEVLDLMDENPHFQRLHTREKRSIVRQAILDMDEWTFEA